MTLFRHNNLRRCISRFGAERCTKLAGHDLGDREASKTGGCQELLQSVPASRLGGKPRHRRADEVRQDIGLLWAARRDEIADHAFGGDIIRAGSPARLGVVATNAFQNKAAWCLLIGGIKARGFLQNCGKTFGHRAVLAQQGGQRNGVIAVIARQNARVEAGLAAKGGVEAGRVDAQGFGDLRDADGVVAAGVEEVLGGGDGLVGVEAAWPATGAG